jgi:hypothetical protein
MTTVLVCATPEVESDLGHTLFWRDDLERYVADRVEDAGALALTTEPHIVVVDLALRGADRLITGLRHQALPHPVSIVALTHDPDEAADNEEAASAVDTVLTLPSSPAWDESLVQVLQVPTRKQARFDVRFDVVSMLRSKPGAHRGLVLNISAGGLLVECAGLPIHPGDDVTLSLPIPGLPKPSRAARAWCARPSRSTSGCASRPSRGTATRACGTTWRRWPPSNRRRRPSSRGVPAARAGVRFEVARPSIAEPGGHEAHDPEGRVDGAPPERDAPEVPEDERPGRDEGAGQHAEAVEPAVPDGIAQRADEGDAITKWPKASQSVP